jgi:hypothetical protein
LEKVKKIRDKMTRGNSRSRSNYSQDSYSVKAYTMQLCGELDPEKSTNNLYERQMGGAAKEEDMGRHGRLIAKYFKQITSRTRSLEGRPASTSRPASEMKWFKEEKKKLNIVERAEMSELTKKRKAT